MVNRESGVVSIQYPPRSAGPCYYLLLAPYYSLLTAYHVLRATRYLPLATCHVSPGGSHSYYLLLTTGYYLLLTTYRWDGLVILGKWVALRGILAAVAKAFLQWYFVNFLL